MPVIDPFRLVIGPAPNLSWMEPFQVVDDRDELIVVLKIKLKIRASYGLVLEAATISLAYPELLSDDITREKVEPYSYAPGKPHHTEESFEFLYQKLRHTQEAITSRPFSALSRFP